MTRVFYSGSLDLGLTYTLDEFASRHISQVLRCKIGNNVKVFNQSSEFLAEITSVAKHSVEIKTLKSLITRTESPLKIHLLQAVTRGERMDYSIQKATELGVTSIQPILTQHCVVKLDERKAGKRLAHWNGIARHATEQSGRLSIPDIHPILDFKEAISHKLSDVHLIFALVSQSSLKSIKESNPSSVCIALGPVGGFSENEVTLALESGYQSIKLGPRILRAETATVAALTAMQMLWGDLN